MRSRPISEIIDAITDEESNELSVFDQLNEEIMSDPTVTVGIAPLSPSADDIEALLGAIDIDEPTGASVEEIVEDEVVEEASELELDEIEVGAAADDEELRALEISLTKSEAYETAESEIEVMASEEVLGAGAETKAAKPKVVRAKSTKSVKPAAPKVERDLKALPDSAFQLALTSDADADKTALLAARPTQKKIAEKFDQTIAALHAGRLPSTYVVDCFKIMKAKSSVTATDLVAALKADGYSHDQAGLDLRSEARSADCLIRMRETGNSFFPGFPFSRNPHSKKWRIPHMARRARLSGDSIYDTNWLQKRMDQLGLGDTEVFRRMQDRGYGGSARTVVTGWRTGKSQIAPDTFPVLCLALDYDRESMARMTLDYLSDTMPLLQAFVAMPSAQELEELERDMQKIGLAQRKARLMAELEELEKLENQ